MTTPPAAIAALSPLHSFFASNFPLLQQQQQQQDEEAVPIVDVQIVSDNARGLNPKLSLSERRRLYEAQQERLGDLFVTAPASPPPRISRWESELPDIVVHTSSTSSSPPPVASPKHQQSMKSSSPKPSSISNATSVLVAPKIPRRRSSVEEDLPKPAVDKSREYWNKKTPEDDHTVSTASSNTAAEDATASTNTRADFPLLPPRRRTSCLEWLDQVEANESATASTAQPLVEAAKRPLAVTNSMDKTQHQLSPPARLSRRCRPDKNQINQNDNPNSLDNHVRNMRQRKNDNITVATANTDAIKKRDSMDKNRKSSVKHAPRRPRRMKSIEWLPSNDDSSNTMDSSSTDVVEGHQDSDSTLRLSLTHSIKTVLDQIKQAEEEKPSYSNGSSKLTSSEQIILKDAVKGVVGALNRRNSQGSTSESSSSSSSVCCKPLPFITN